MSKCTLIGSVDLKTKYGDLVQDEFSVYGNQVIVVRSEQLSGTPKHVKCRIQSECTKHVFGSVICDCDLDLERALKWVSDDGLDCEFGLVIYLRQDGMGLGATHSVDNASLDFRLYHEVAEILNYYGIKSIKLLTSDKKKMGYLISKGFSVIRKPNLSNSIFELSPHADRLIERCKQGLAYRPFDTDGCDGKTGEIKNGNSRPEKSLMLVLGDMNVDILERENVESEFKAGGSGLNAALAFKSLSFAEPVLFGKVGNDNLAGYIRKKIVDYNIMAFLGVHETKKTGCVEITSTGTDNAWFDYRWDKINNANDYDSEQLKQAIYLSGITENDYIYLPTYLFVQKRYCKEMVREVLDLIGETGAKVILDLARKSLQKTVMEEVVQDKNKYQTVDVNLVQEFIDGYKFYAVICEMKTLESLGLNVYDLEPNEDQQQEIINTFNSTYIICNYVDKREAKKKQVILKKRSEMLKVPHSAAIEGDQQVGDGDRMTREALEFIYNTF